MKSGTPKQRLSSAELFAAIFYELTEAIGDQVSSAKLLEAADHLVRLINDDFGVHREEKSRPYGNYYSHETDSAISDRQWQILCKECAQDYLEGEAIDPTFLARRLKELGIYYG